MIHITGENFLGYKRVANSSDKSVSYNPTNNQVLDGEYTHATLDNLQEAVKKAKRAFYIYKQTSAELRAQFLDLIATNILGLETQLIERCMAETALPEARIIGERGRTVNQLKQFASMLREGSWVNASIDLAQPSRTPVPKPDLRKMMIAIGPVAVFAAGNFPLAYSVAGGDTAAALAVGCPVIVKAHSGHLGTSELIATAISNAALALNLPDGVFSLLHGSGEIIGQSLVRMPQIKAVGFTGSRFAGRELMNIAAAREEPIPVFAEMGSINPVLFLDESLKLNSESLAKNYAASITLNCGQFCTNPGLMFAIESDALNTFIHSLKEQFKQLKPQTMLNSKTFSQFAKHKKAVLEQKNTHIICQSDFANQAEINQAEPLVVKISAKEFLSNPIFKDEVFGPYSLLVVCQTRDDLQNCLSSLDGQLVASVLAEPADLATYDLELDMLRERAGRIILNGVPTGVDVCPSQNHSGPYPASSDSRFGAVGTDSAYRFVRPLAYQNWQNEFLPDELKNENPLGIWRKIDNILSKEVLAASV